jgi:hypothetical protein
MMVKSVIRVHRIQISGGPTWCRRGGRRSNPVAVLQVVGKTHFFLFAQRVVAVMLMVITDPDPDPAFHLVHLLKFSPIMFFNFVQKARPFFIQIE